MTELAVTDGMPPPADLPRGEFIAWPTGTGSQFFIKRADPRIVISAELLALVAVNPAPGVSLEQAPVPGEPFWSGAVLRIKGVNRTVIYRIGAYVPRVNGYIAEWPD